MKEEQNEGKIKGRGGRKWKGKEGAEEDRRDGNVKEEEAEKCGEEEDQG